MVDILITEDEWLIAEEFKLILCNTGDYNVEIVASGEEALIKMKKFNPKLIFMDIHLAGDIDGISTAIKINKISKIPIIFITAFRDDNLIFNMKKLMPEEILFKPIEDKVLISTVKRVLSKVQ